MKLQLLLIFVLFSLLTSHEVYAQEGPVVDFCENEPEFPGGEEAMMKFIQNNIEYPKASVAKGEQGIVYFQFIIYKDGHIDGIKIMRGVCDNLNKEAMRVIALMPNWKAGEQKGKKMNVRYTLPINFRLTDGKEKMTKKERRQAEREKKKMLKHNK